MDDDKYARDTEYGEEYQILEDEICYDGTAGDYEKLRRKHEIEKIIDRTEPFARVPQGDSASPRPPPGPLASCASLIDRIQVLKVKGEKNMMFVIIDFCTFTCNSFSSCPKRHARVPGRSSLASGLLKAAARAPSCTTRTNQKSPVSSDRSSSAPNADRFFSNQGRNAH